VGPSEQGEPQAKRVLGAGGLRIELDPPGGDQNVVVRLFGELDMEAATLLEDQLGELISGPAPTVTVDLGGLAFVDSSGLQCLMRATEHSRANGDKLRFRRGSQQVEGVLRLTQISDRLPFAD
jgi:anti-sigma B factor antagonist